MKTWTERPKEEAYLLNPALCCITLVSAIGSYSDANKENIPFPLMFMVLPIVLHKPTRDALPPSIRTSMAAWLQENAFARVQFYERLVSLNPYTREAIQFGMSHGWTSLRAGGLLSTPLNDADVNRVIRILDDEARECVMRARFFGKWLAAAGATHTVMAFWGIRP